MDRAALHELLENLFGSKDVYYQTPPNTQMKYPCIKYSKSDIYTKRADNLLYKDKDVYEIVVIDWLPDNPVIKKIIELPYTTFIRHYVVDKLNHDVIRIYY